MTTLYKPVKITSAEQAEALPVGTLARHSSGPGMDHAHKVQGLSMQMWVSYAGNLTNSSMVGFVALVPIEAEEETLNRPSTALGDAVRALAGRNSSTLHRLVTPWTPTEEA